MRICFVKDLLQEVGVTESEMTVDAVLDVYILISIPYL